MKKIVVFNLPAHGHINPSLSVVKELVDRGNQVIYYSEKEFESKIIATGAIYKECKQLPNIKAVNQSALLNNYYLLLFRILGKTYLSVDYFLDEVREIKPDYIMYDSVCFWGKCVSEILGIRSISLNTAYLFNFKKLSLRLLGKDIAMLRFSKLLYFIKSNIIHKIIIKKFGIKKEELLDRFYSKGDLNFVFTSKQFQNNYEKYENMNFQFVGPSILDRGEEYDDIDYSKLTGKVIYIALGTITNNEVDFYKNCIKSLENHQGTVVMSLGNKIDKESLGRVPSNFIIRNYINQLQLLKHVDIFISHGGMNSVQEGLFHGVPLLISPHHIEQGIIGKRVCELGCGLVMQKNSSRKLFHHLGKILDNYDYYKNNCIRIAKTLHDAGGYKKVVDMIEKDFDSKNGHNGNNTSNERQHYNP